MGDMEARKEGAAVIYSNPAQSRFLNAIRNNPWASVFIFTAGYGSGKSHFDVQHILELYSRYNGYDITGIIGSSTMKRLRQTLLLDLSTILKSHKIPFNYNKQENELTIGSLKFIIVNLELPEDIFGLNAQISLMDELDTLPTDKALAAFTKVQERTRKMLPDGREPYIVISSTANGLKGVYTLYNKFKKEGVPFVWARGSTSENPYFAKSALRMLENLYNEKEKRALIHGEFVNLNVGRVYPEFDPKVNVYMDFKIKQSDVVYIGADFNCVGEGTGILTKRGEIPIEDVIPGKDFVFTREGWKKVLTLIPKGVNFVSRRFNGPDLTDDHPVITPEGEMEAWKAKNYYYLPKRSRLLLIRGEELNAKLSSLMGEYIDDINRLKEEENTNHISILSLGKEVEKIASGSLSMLIYGSIITKSASLSVMLSIIKTALMTIGLKVLNVCLMKNIPVSTLLRIIQRKDLNGISIKTGFWSGTGARKGKNTIRVRQEKTGTAGQCLTRRYVLSAGRSILQELLLRCSALMNAINITEGTVATDSWRQSILRYARNAVRSLWLRKTPQSVARKTAETDRHIGERWRKKVFDLTIEDKHEFFAGGVLVHNCGYNTNSALINRNGTIYVVEEFKCLMAGDVARTARKMFPENDIVLIPDASAKEIMRGYLDECEEYDVRIMIPKQNPGISERILCVNKLFRMKKLWVMQKCEGLIMGLEIRGFDEQTGEPEKRRGENSPDHGLDSLEYSSHYIINNSSGFEDLIELINFQSANRRETKYMSAEGLKRYVNYRKQAG
jgi:hypothetical protein